MLENYIWLIVAVLLAVVVGLTLSLTTIWFALGALAAWIFKLLNFSLSIQLTVFVLVSGLLLIFTRPIIKKYLKAGRVKTNAEELVGMNALVIETINNINAEGKVKVKGQIWTARSNSNELISRDEIVKVIRIEGVKLIVEKSQEDK